MHRALVVDDSAIVRHFLTGILRELSFDVFEAPDGRSGLALLGSMSDVTLVLVDWNMPGLDGLEFVKSVRADRVYDAVCMMMVTTEIEMHKVSTALDAGANEYLMKPCTREMVRDKLVLLGLLGGD